MLLFPPSAAHNAGGQTMRHKHLCKQLSGSGRLHLPDNCCKIAIARFDLQKGEQTAHAYENAWFRQLLEHFLLGRCGPP